MAGRLFLLGPQRPTPNLPTVLETVPGDGSVIYITAGWRHDESDDDALRRDIGPPGQLLPLYGWFEQLARLAPDLFQAHHAQQQEIRKVKNLYRLRLETALEAARVLLEQRERHPDSEFVQWELEDSLEALRGLRTRFILQCDSIRNRFLKEWKPSENPYVRRRIEQISHVLSDARAVLIAGGHVGVLRNRLEFFELAPMLSALIERDGAVIAWSAGAMALTELVVLFHDDPPTGQLHAEVLDHGLGLASGIVVLPHARDRLFLDDPSRVSVMASRFRPHPCIGIENGAWLHRRGDTWVNLGETESAFRLHADGTVAPIETASSEVGDASDI